MSQTTDLIRYMKKRSITPIDALRELGCFRLAARINDLRNSGYNIRTDTVKDGEKRYARYTLIRG